MDNAAPVIVPMDRCNMEPDIIVQARAEYDTIDRTFKTKRISTYKSWRTSKAILPNGRRISFPHWAAKRRFELRAWMRRWGPKLKELGYIIEELAGEETIRNRAATDAEQSLADTSKDRRTKYYKAKEAIDPD